MVVRADFRHVIIVMTTNAGAEVISRSSMGFTEQMQDSDTLRKLNVHFHQNLEIA